MPILYVLQGPDRGRTFKTPDEPSVLGRQSENVPLTDRTVSRRHARLVPSNGAWVLEDMDSANGTYVNGIRLDKPVRLKDGDQIKIGSTLLVYGGDVAEPRSGMPAARDLVDLDVSSRNLDSAILASMPVSDESVIIAAPETADAARAWRVLRRLLEAIGTVGSPDQILEIVMDVIFEEVRVDRAFILMREPGSDDLLPAAVRYRHVHQGEPPRITTSRRIINLVCDKKEGILCSNAMTDTRLGGDPKGGSIVDYGLTSVICAPILVRDEVLGVIHVDSSTTNFTFSQEQLRLITAIGHMTGLAIQNARLVQSRMQTTRLAAVGETVAYLSHYIKNILQGIQNGSDLVQNGLRRRELPLVSQGWNVVDKNLDKILQLTMNMLAYSKPREPRIEMVQLNKIVADAMTLAQRRADEKSVMLLSDLEEPFPAVPIDPDGIHQVALNLINNAIDATEPGKGLVNIETRFDAQNERATLAVADNGPGIPPELHERIFEPFHSSKGQSGTGLGLAAARKIVEEHGGHIIVRSTSGEGTVMRVVLPLTPEARGSEKTFGPAR